MPNELLPALPLRTRRPLAYADLHRSKELEQHSGQVWAAKFAVLAVFLASQVAIVAAMNERSKESHVVPGDGNTPLGFSPMVSTDGTAVATMPADASKSFSAILSWDEDTLDKFKSVRFYTVTADAPVSPDSCLSTDPAVKRAHAMAVAAVEFNGADRASATVFGSASGFQIDVGAEHAYYKQVDLDANDTGEDDTGRRVCEDEGERQRRLLSARDNVLSTAQRRRLYHRKKRHSSSTKNNCFPSDATAETENGDYVRMDHLCVGDRVMTAAGACPDPPPRHDRRSTATTALALRGHCLHRPLGRVPLRRQRPHRRG